MKFIPRILSNTIHKAIKTFPAIVLTGPRQSGKTTLLKKIFGQYKFISLENPDIRLRAKEDPISFLNQYPAPLVIDEIQYVPELLSFIKTKIDDHRKPGQWILTGSQNFSLMHNVSQSLAGRAAILSLLPFSVCERTENTKNSLDIKKLLVSQPTNTKSIKTPLHEILLRGFYPEIANNKNVDRQLWCSSYITTYLERDIRNLLNVGDLNQFERFLKSCASRTGQILNLSELARDIGISVPTAKRWISMLEAGYQIYLLYPYYKNIGKRLIKSPKLYFTDTGLASFLLGIHDRETLLNGPSFPHLFETLIVCDFLKRFHHSGQMPSLYYLKSQDGLEVDLVIELAGQLHLFEIKSTSTVTSKHATSLKRLGNELGPAIKTASLISCSQDSFPLTNNIFNFSWQRLLVS